MSSSRGANETERLKKNLSDQMNRLLTQLQQDLEELRDEIDDDEYEEVRSDTLEQMEEIQSQIQKVSSGDISLVSELGAMKLALRAAIANAFKTPEVIRMFAQKEPGALRERLAQLHEMWKLGRIKNKNEYKSKVTEIIVALKKLNETLTDEEKAFLQKNDDAMREFEDANRAIGENVMSMAKSDVQAAFGS